MNEFSQLYETRKDGPSLGKPLAIGPGFEKIHAVTLTSINQSGRFPFGCGSKFKGWGYTTVGLCFHPRGPKMGSTCLIHSHLASEKNPKGSFNKTRVGRIRPRAKMFDLLAQRQWTPKEANRLSRLHRAPRPQ